MTYNKPFPKDFNYFKERNRVITDIIDNILLLESETDRYLIGYSQTKILELLSELKTLDEKNGVFIKSYTFIGVNI